MVKTMVDRQTDRQADSTSPRLSHKPGGINNFSKKLFNNIDKL